MNYNLAKELKEAGFPQTMNGTFCHEDNYVQCYGFGMADDGTDEVKENGKGYTGCDETDCPKLAKCPSLSELIESCGKITLVGLEGHNWQAQGGKMEINKETMQGGYATYEKGKTPEEAVARLWLALNKNALH